MTRMEACVGTGSAHGTGPRRRDPVYVPARGAARIGSDSDRIRAALGRSWRARGRRIATRRRGRRDGRWQRGRKRAARIQVYGRASRRRMPSASRNAKLDTVHGRGATGATDGSRRAHQGGRLRARRTRR